MYFRDEDPVNLQSAAKMRHQVIPNTWGWNQLQCLRGLAQEFVTDTPRSLLHAPRKAQRPNCHLSLQTRKAHHAAALWQQHGAAIHCLPPSKPPAFGYSLMIRSQGAQT